MAHLRHISLTPFDRNNCPKVTFSSRIGIVNNLKITDNGFSFDFGGIAQKVTVQNLEKPDWLCDGVVVEIDFNEKHIRLSR